MTKGGVSLRAKRGNPGGGIASAPERLAMTKGVVIASEAWQSWWGVLLDERRRWTL